MATGGCLALLCFIVVRKRILKLLLCFISVKKLHLYHNSQGNLFSQKTLNGHDVAAKVLC